MLDTRLRPLWQLSQNFVKASGADYIPLFEQAQALLEAPSIPPKARHWLIRRMDEEQQSTTHQRRRGLHVCT